jgi:mycothiol synthase
MPNETRDIESFTFRQFDPEADVPRLLTLLAETEAVDQEGSDISEETVREQLGWLEHDPVRDRFVVEQPGDPNRLIGYALLWKMPNENHGDVMIVVHPDWRRRGLGSELLARALSRARALNTAQLGAYANVQHTAGGAFLRRFGFTPVAAYTALRAHGNHPFAAPAWPAGYRAHRYAEMDDATRFATFVEATNRCYAGLWGHHEVTEEAAAQWIATLDQEGIHLLFAPDGRVAGMCCASMNERLSKERRQPVGWVDAPGIVPEYRDENLYLPLLLTAVQWVCAKHPTPAVIEMESWGDTPETLATYQRAGFVVARKEDSYRLDLI